MRMPNITSYVRGLKSQSSQHQVKSQVVERAVAVARVESSTTIEMLKYLHEALDIHFASLNETRAALDPKAPVFALEHDLPAEDLDLLMRTVRAAVCAGLDARNRSWWLPFVVYAAESGYSYVGDEYWRTFEQATPGWSTDHRHWIKTWFQKFAAEYGGAEPVGAFAASFKIIAWPITHAVLPTYLQRHLAQLLYEFSGALTSELLNDSDALGSSPVGWCIGDPSVWWLEGWFFSVL